jgi:hypothetical protein
MSFKIPFFDYSDAWSGILKNTVFGMSPLPRALFSEKSHLSQYLVPYIALYLYSSKAIPKHRLLKAIITSAVVLSTVSGNGTLIVLIEWLMYFLFFSQVKKNYKIAFSSAGIIMSHNQPTHRAINKEGEEMK